MHAAILARAAVDDVAHVLATADAVAQRLDTTVALLDPAAVYNARHLDSAVLHAERAWREGRQSARTLSAEVLLYASGELQVTRAIERCGIRPGLDRAVVLAVGPKCGAAIWGLLDKLGWSRDPAGIPENPSALVRHGHPGTTPERDPEKWILQRVALVDAP